MYTNVSVPVNDTAASQFFVNSANSITFSRRINIYHLSLEEALTTPPENTHHNKSFQKIIERYQAKLDFYRRFSVVKVQV